MARRHLLASALRASLPGISCQLPASAAAGQWQPAAPSLFLRCFGVQLQGQGQGVPSSSLAARGANRPVPIAQTGGSQLLPPATSASQAIRAAASSTDSSLPEDYDPVRTRIIHLMVLGTFLVAGSNVLPYLGVHSVENSAKLLESKDSMLARAGADRLRYLAASSDKCRVQMASGPVLDKLTSKIHQGATPDVILPVLAALVEIVKEEEARASLASDSVLQLELVALSSSSRSNEKLQEDIRALATQLLVDVNRPPLST